MKTLKEKYDSEVKAELKNKFGFKNIHQIPKLEKIVINCVTRDCVQNGKMVENIVADLAAISGQKPVIARAKKSVASFKLREGQALGALLLLEASKCTNSWKD